jgi:hypothetical protein
VVTIRSDRSTFAALFDQPDSTAPADHRTISTVAPQALYLWNHPFVFEQATGLADRLLARLPGPNAAARIDHAYRLLYARLPAAEEVAIGLDLLSARRRAGDSEKAAWEAYAHVLLCANEFIYLD